MSNSNRRRNRGLELGVILLVYELLNVGTSAIPPTTLFTIIGQALLYIGIINTPWQKWDVCMSGETVYTNGEYRRLVLGTLEHGDDMHLYYNMISYLMKGRSLETRYGSLNFLMLICFLVLATSSIYVALAVSMTNLFANPIYMKTCTIGFSGVIFGLKVITTKEEPFHYVNIFDVPVPSTYATWAELIAIHILVPNASFSGHLAGILAGLVYTSTPVGCMLDFAFSKLTGVPLNHRYGVEEE